MSSTSQEYSFLSLDFCIDSAEAVLGLICLLLNWTLAYVTVRSKWLHSPCNILLAIYAVSLSAYAVPFILSLILTLSIGANYTIAYSTCFWVYTPLLVLFAGAHTLLLAIAADRFISVKFAIRYTQINKSIYVSLIVCAALFYGAIFGSMALQNAIATPNATTQGFISSTLGKQTLYLSMADTALEVPTVCLYVTIGIMLRRSKVSAHTGAAELATRRIYKSLLAILLIEIAGLATSSVSNSVMPHLNLSATTFNYLFWTTTLFALISCCSGSVILYSYSSEYRRAFNAHIPLLARLSGANKVSTAPVVHVTPQQQQQLEASGRNVHSRINNNAAQQRNSHHSIAVQH